VWYKHIFIWRNVVSESAHITSHTYSRYVTYLLTLRHIPTHITSHTYSHYVTYILTLRHIPTHITSHNYSHYVTYLLTLRQYLLTLRHIPTHITSHTYSHYVTYLPARFQYLSSPNRNICNSLLYILQMLPKLLCPFLPKYARNFCLFPDRTYL
jgi:hypothetical protein